MKLPSARPTLVACALLLLAPEAWSAPPTKVECIAAFDAGQQARREGALLQSRRDLLLCSQSECPAIVRADCAGVLRQVDAAQPTLVLRANDRQGNDVTEVTVELDGRTLATALDGRPIPVDPGKLTLVFRRPPWPPLTAELLIAEGEKDRIVRATLGPPLPPPVVMSDAAATPPPKRSVAGWAVPGGLAVFGASALTFAGLTRLSIGDRADALRVECGPGCPAAERDHLASRLATANAALVVGLGSMALGAIAWLVLAPKGSSRALAQSLALVAGVAGNAGAR